tara:strand:- start:5388 stop:5534 length:147 start_codon:yes stop_codon:yes gene_type:complete
MLEPRVDFRVAIMAKTDDISLFIAASVLELNDVVPDMTSATARKAGLP